jgi:hypothetical protein
MHAATQTLLNRIEQGQKILVVEGDAGTFEFGRPKDPTAVIRSVTKIETVKDQWSGKVYTVQITGGRRNTGRYGTTHVYVPVEEALPPTPPTSTVMELDLADPQESRRVIVKHDGTMWVHDWTGGTVIRTTPKGRVVRIDADGELTLVKDFPEESDEQLDEANAGEPGEHAHDDRCGQCKGYGVVRKRGSQAGKAYRTLNGSQAATANGNAAECPVCLGTGLVGRAA